MADNVNLIINETIENVVINPTITTEIVDVNVSGTDTTVDISVTPNLTIVNIRQITGSTTGAGSTNLFTTQTANSFTINSDTGGDAVVPLGNGFDAGASLNNYTTAEQTKLGKYPSTATNGTILQGNGTNYVEIATPTGTTNLNYEAAPTIGTITSSTGDDATIPLANGTNAGLLSPFEKTKIANSVPYTGATSDVNLGEFGIQLGNLEFDNTPTNTPTTSGSMYWNDVDGTLNLILKGGNVTLQVGQETVIRVVNKTATNISLLESNYQAVRITGSQGQRPKVDLAQATNDLLSAETIGLVTETIANNQEGFITTSGLVRGINTTGSLQGETWVDGDIIYLSPTIAGSLTKVKPIAPNHLVIIGYVIHAHITQGTIFVKVDNGYELDELHNIKINGVANNNVLAYTSSTSIWENKTVETALGYTPYNATNPSGFQTSAQVQTIADAKVTNTITDGVTTTAPSEDVVFDALALKANDSAVVHNTGAETVAGLKTFSDGINAGQGSPYYNTIAYLDGTGKLGGLFLGVYPTLSELSFVKGVQQVGIQTQINTKNDLIVAHEVLGSTIKGHNLGVPLVSQIATLQAMVSNQNRLTAYYIPYDTTITGIRWYQANQGVYTTSGTTYNGIGLYKWSANTLTLVAQTTTDDTIWKGASGSFRAKTLSSPYSATKGIYYIGLMWTPLVNTTTPAIGTGSSYSANSLTSGFMDFSSSGKFNPIVVGVTQLTTPITPSGLNAVPYSNAVFLY